MPSVPGKQQEEDERSVFFPGADEREVTSRVVGPVVAMVALRVAVVSVMVILKEGQRECRKERREGVGREGERTLILQEAGGLFSNVSLLLSARS